MTRIVLAEDQPLILESLKILLGEDPSVAVVSAVTDGSSALEAIRSCKPDVAVLDIRMPVLSGLEVAQAVKEEGLQIPILLLTTFDEPESAQTALNAGVEGFLLKDVEPETFILAVKAVHRGLTVFHPAIRAHLSLKPNHRSVAGRDYGLTDRDLCIVQAIVQGLSNKEIADKDGCTEGTVKNRVSSILGKMNLNARTQIAVTALRENLI